MKKVLYKVLDRLKEPSTYSGLAALAILFGISMEEFQLYANVAASVAALASTFIPEKKK